MRVLVIIMAGILLSLGALGCGGGSAQTVSTVTQTSTDPTTPQPPNPAPRQQPPAAPGSFHRYFGSGFTLDTPTGWTTEEDQTQKASSLMESKWRDPADPATSILIDTIPSTTNSAQADAAAVQAQTSSTPGYREIDSMSESVSGSDGWKWTFEVSGAERVDYFVNACGSSYAILGSTTPGRFSSLAPAFQHVADSIQLDCSSSSNPAPSPPTDTSTTTTTSSAAPAGCQPTTDSGNCYEPGEYCRDSDHGMTGVAGNGESIVCSDNNGWRWEPN